MFALSTGSVVNPLSAHHVCDCARGMCCGGGWPEDVFYFARANGGIATVKDYPYMAKNSICKYITPTKLVSGVGVCVRVTFVVRPSA